MAGILVSTSTFHSSSLRYPDDAMLLYLHLEAEGRKYSTAFRYQSQTAALRIHSQLKKHQGCLVDLIIDNDGIAKLRFARETIAL